jgi:hypothetical protein
MIWHWLTTHADVLLAALIAACILAVPLLVLADGLRSSVRWALARWRAGRADDAFAPAVADEFADITQRLAGDFEHIDIRRLEALYLVDQETNR